MNGSSKLKTAAEAALVCAAILLAIFLRLPLLLNVEALMNSDSAFNALSVRHLLSGDAFFLYHPGQDYQGITEALVGVLLTKLFGWSALAFSCAPLLFYLAFLVVIYLLAREAFGVGAAAKAILLAAVVPGLMARYSLIATGGHMFVPLAGALLVWFLFRYAASGRPAWLYAIGFLAGFSYYTYKLSVVVIAPAALCLVYHSGLVSSLLQPAWLRQAAPASGRKWILRALDVAIVVALVFVAWALLFESLRIVAGPVKIGAGHLSRAVVRAGALIFLRVLLCWPQLKPWLAARGRVMAFFLASVLLGLMPVIAAHALCPPDAQTKPIEFAEGEQLAGNLRMLHEDALPELLAYARPPESASDLAGYAAARASAKLLGVAYALAILYAGFRVLRRDGRTLVFARQGGLSHEGVLLLFLVTPAAAYVFSNYIYDVTSHRYLVPVFVALPPLIAFAAQQVSGFARRRFAVPGAGWALVLAVVAATLAYNVWYFRWDGGLGETGFRIQKQRVVARDAVEYLGGRGITRAYGTYWTCYLMTFLADERIVVAPFEKRDERKPPDYARVVREAPNAAYIFTGIDANRREKFEDGLRRRGIRWKYREIPGSMRGFHVYEPDAASRAK